MRKIKEINKVLPAPNKIRVSDVIAIPLNHTYWAYARICKTPSMAILDVVSNEQKVLCNIIKANTKVVFYIEFYEPYDVSPWVYLGKWKFENEDESWGPPVFIKDIIDPKRYRILHRGKMTNCTEDQVKGLNPHGLMAPEGIKRKIMLEFKTFRMID